MNRKRNIIYIHIDGDGIGDQLELFLLDGKIKEAKIFSNNVHKAMEEVSISIQSIEGSELLLLGGDDLIALCHDDKNIIDKIENIRSNFKQKTGCTLSVGVGTSIQEALNNLRRAKLSGKDRIIINTEK